MSDLKFSPSIEGVGHVDFRPYMIENAYDYYKISTGSPHQRMGIQAVMCALSIEIILKSFHASVTSNHGKLNETYEFKKSEALPKRANAHDLIVLYESLPENIQRYLFDSLDLKVLAANKDLFTKSRYAYEPNANKSHTDSIIKLAASLICKMVFLYRSFGCNDPFIELFDIEELYFGEVRSFLWCSEP
ncbi:hypothetical protein P3602_24975 [Vibrio parahaemolyticus]|uniref:hypothetical protein n=1 Tax=Vibrio parahaemolyticus TaxID=670 RepID=UPI00111EC517|nr:hypothetical protein [Vibrio parahaemolyticus]MCR9797990.1 hypothetical protein [Vibrio parahaemolyticus]MDF4316687.1 hypothetical protein [Vibrio parahaemolyticus]MDF4966702.1 hypothetical protein [Vibrio parahaemolyticus]MDF5029384.1 hypothetical protein [Vibrio parahaemolyticus]MDF5063525.1 hypothetical protein [Vibrio parahaemolyticus]